jgi:hypothetical protein
MLLLLTATNFFGQEAPQIKFDAKITSVENQGSKLDVVKVYVSEGGKLKDSTVTQNGRMFYQLDTGKVYKIEFTKAGYISKHLIVSTVDAPESIKQKSKLKVEVSLFRHKNGLEVDFLKTKPMGVARYNYMTGKLEWDKDYTRSIIEMIITATLELYNETKADE